MRCRKKWSRCALGGPAKKINVTTTPNFTVNFLSNGCEFLNFDCRLVLRRLELIGWKVNLLQMQKKVVPLGGPAKKIDVTTTFTFTVNFLTSCCEFLYFFCRFVLRRLKFIG